MKRNWNFFRTLPFALLVMWLGAFAPGASGASEKSIWEADGSLFSLARSPETWSIVEGKFAKFIKDYPNSEHFPEAVVYEARALFEQGKLNPALELLASQSSRAGKSADSFAYWTAKIYERKGENQLAADNYLRLIRDAPDSPLRPEAIYRRAEIFAKMGDWPRVTEELQDPAGAFQTYAGKNPQTELVLSGMLLLAQAGLEQKNFAAAEKIVDTLDTKSFPVTGERNLEWDRQALRLRLELAQGQMEEAQKSATNLLAAAGTSGDLATRSRWLQAQVFERQEKWGEAIKVYEINLTSDTVGPRRQALLKIVELDLRQNKLPEGAQQLDDYLTKYPAERGADFEALLAGELKMKQYYLGDATGAVTNNPLNFLNLAETNFLKIIATSTNRQVLGKAQLNLGWCFLAQKKIPESQQAFSNAVATLAFSEDKAVAQFKVADLKFQTGDFSGALAEYLALIGQYESVPSIKNQLFEGVLYQIVRAAQAETNAAAATDAMKKILEWFPNSVLGERSVLLVGQSDSPADARELFSAYAAKNPGSPLMPELELAVARTYEREGNWTAALQTYNQWVAAHTNNAELARGEFALAWANYRAGNETNAYNLFTNFVAKFPSNELAPKAQYWVGDFFWNQDEFQKAELSYEEVFNKWPDSTQSFAAQMAAGRAALARESPQGAQVYFTNLMANPKCPAGLWAQAAFALGDSTLMISPTLNSNRYFQAITIFKTIATDPKYTNSLIAAQSWGRLGDCYYLMASNNNDPVQLQMAGDYFSQAMNATGADATVRGQAEFRLGETAEAIARLLSPDANGKPVFKLALDHFYNVFSGASLRENEKPDPFWAKKAALESAKLAEETGEWRQAIQWYQEIGKNSPVLQPVLDQKISKDQEYLSAEKN